MNELQIFESEQFGKIRTIEQDNEILFVASDVCRALGVDRSQTRRLENDEKGVCLIQTPGGEQNVGVVNEYGLYGLVLTSRKPEAKAFKRWITHEVIPAIRNHGGYLTEEKIEEVLLNPDTIIKLATTLKEEKAKRAEAERQLEEAKPKVVFADAVSASDDTILIRDLAKLIRQNGYEIGEKRLYEWLRNNGYLIKSGGAYNRPTQKAMELGLFRVKETAITHSDKQAKPVFTTKVTGKGQQYFINKFLSNKKED